MLTCQIISLTSSPTSEDLETMGHNCIRKSLSTELHLIQDRGYNVSDPRPSTISVWLDFLIRIPVPSATAKAKAAFDDIPNSLIHSLLIILNFYIIWTPKAMLALSGFLLFELILVFLIDGVKD
ncbi:hypothetical protein CDL15_Pgr006610 [Punica granatum]|uniref:Uncharacterized protein n=1 Tax=Punica granatum TaxID=22663 RepID=A0A218X7B4_PUNGR|nr:hypothetical protein CDL15_Pgr006610 [Punica granatum]